MYCQGCSGFGSNGEAEVEVESEEINDTSIQIECKVNVPCGNCGDSFKEAYTSIEAEIDADSHDDECVIVDTENGDVEVTLETDPDRFRELVDANRVFELQEVNLEVSDDYRPKYKMVRDRKTKQVKQVPVPFRYQRHFYDIAGTASVKCNACDGVFEVHLEGEVTAGELEAA